MAFNQHSRSTPARLVQAPNHPGICLNLKSNDVLSQEDKNLGISFDLINSKHELTTKPKCLSYNDCIKNYDLSLLTPNKITVNHLFSMCPIFGDISDAFGHILL